MNKRLLLGSLSVTLILLCLGGLYLYFQSLPDMCGNVVLAEYLAPNKKIKAVTYHRDCGATTALSIQVSLVPLASALENESGNIFVADTIRGAAPAGQAGAPEVRVTWLSDTWLQIEHHKLARTFRTETRYQGVKVDYLTY